MAKHKFEKGNKFGKGRPKGSGYMQELEDALERFGKKKFFDMAFTMAQKEPSVMVALLKKMVPDQVEVKQNVGLLLDE